MKRVKQFSQIFLVFILLTSCRSSINNDDLKINSEGNINENANSEKKRMEIKFSCGEDKISEYLNNGWSILKEDSQEKICTWKSVPATKDCDLEEDKGCKITNQIKLEKRKFIFGKIISLHDFKI